MLPAKRRPGGYHPGVLVGGGLLVGVILGYVLGAYLSPSCSQQYGVNAWKAANTVLVKTESTSLQTITSFSDPLYASFPPSLKPHEMVEGCRVLLAPQALDPVITRSALSSDHQYCTLFSLDMLLDPSYKPYLEATGVLQGVSAGILHRKAWEFAHVLRTLDRLGKIKPDAIGLALAAGKEAVHYYLSTRIAKMYAGDIYGVGGFAADGTSARSVLENPGDFVPPGVEWNKDNLQLLFQDARNLSFFKDNSVDFLYSLSSIEHFGGDEKPPVGKGAAQSVREQARILKPGGISFLAVDTVITGQGDEPGNGYTPAQLQDAIFKPAAESGLELVEPVHWGLTPTALNTGVHGGALGYEDNLVCATSPPHGVYCQDVTRLRWWTANPDYKELPLRCLTSLALVFRKRA